MSLGVTDMISFYVFNDLFLFFSSILLEYSVYLSTSNLFLKSNEFHNSFYYFHGTHMNTKKTEILLPGLFCETQKLSVVDADRPDNHDDDGDDDDDVLMLIDEVGDVDDTDENYVIDD